jgi:hypothetical protein
VGWGWWGGGRLRIRIQGIGKQRVRLIDQCKRG